MYVKSIKLSNNSDRYLFSLAFKYNLIFIFGLLVILAMIFFIKKEEYYQNIITFINNKEAIIMVEKDYLNIVKEKNKLIMNKISYEYNIDKIEEGENIYFVYIHFDIELNINSEYYKIYLKKERLIEYFIRITRRLNEKIKWIRTF